MRLRFLKSGGDEFEVVDDVDVLRALGLALSALQALAGLAMAFGHQVIIEFAVALLLGELLHGVVEAEVLGDGNLLRTTLTAVMASGAMDSDGVADDFGCLSDDG